MELNQSCDKEFIDKQIPQMEELLGLSAPDGRIGFALESTLLQILAYLHCETLPEPLMNTWLLMTATQWKEGVFGGSLMVSHLSRGDVSTTFASPSQRNTDGFWGYKSALDAYRKLRR